MTNTGPLVNTTGGPVSQGATMAGKTNSESKAAGVRFDANGRPIVRTRGERAVARPSETRG